MKRRISKAIICLGLFVGVGLYACAALYAETIILKSGKKVSGKIIEQDDSHTLIELSSGIELSFKNELIGDEKKIDEEPAKDFEPTTNIIDARTHEPTVSLEDRQQVMSFLNETSNIDGSLKEILTDKSMKFDNVDDDVEKEKARVVIEKRIGMIEDAVKDLEVLKVPVDGRDFYDTLHLFYRSMIKAEQEMLATWASDKKDEGGQAIDETLKLAEQADQALNKLLSDYHIVDVQHERERRQQDGLNKAVREKEKEDYEAQQAEMKRKKIKQDKMRQRQDFLRYLNYY